MRFWRLLFYLMLPVFWLCSCDRNHHTVTRGFYYWKTIYRPAPFELIKLRELNVSKLYIRLFDVDADLITRRAIPVAPLRIYSKDSGFMYVPVIFITQKALAVMNDSTLQQVARNICHLADVLCGQAGIKTNELQIDCDWTGSTKDQYFALLRAIKKHTFMTDKQLSCTIRLHQVKYLGKSGVPPADRGVVMCYSMGTLKKQGTLNSILDADEAKDYLQHIGKYPLPVDVALPLFEWCVLFHDRQFTGILHDITTDAIKKCSLFQQKNNNLYTCKQDSVWLGYSFKAGDIIRLEEPSYADIMSVADASARLISNTDVNVIFFDCDSITLKKFSKDELETIYNKYR